MKRFALLLLTALSFASTADAQRLLRQGTAATIKLGPFVDASDGVTAETGLTISQADIRLSKNGGAFAQSNDDSGATHDENGWYDVPLDEDDTDTLGRLTVAIHESGALPVWVEFMVVDDKTWLISNGVQYTPSGGRIWVVEASGGNASGLYTEDDPGTLTGAASSVASGDTCRLLAGTYSTAVDFSGTPGVTIEGVDRDTVTITAEVDGGTDEAVVLLTDYCTLRRCTVTNTGDAQAVKARQTIGVLLEDCYIDGETDGVDFSNTVEATARRCVIRGAFDAVTCNRAKRFLIDRCDLETDGTWTLAPAFDARALIASGATGRVVDSRLVSHRTDDTASNEAAIALEVGAATDGTVSPVVVINCQLVAIQDNASAEGNAQGIGRGTAFFDTATAKHLTLLGGSIVTRNDGSGANQTINASDTGSLVMVSGTAFDRTLAAGTSNIEDTATDVATARERIELALPSVAPTANGGLPTVDGNNRIAGLQGTITTLDALDTAQDVQHGTTQANQTTIINQTTATAQRSALGLTSANLDTQLSGLDTKLGETEDDSIVERLAAIRLDTGTTLPGLVQASGSPQTYAKDRVNPGRTWHYNIGSTISPNTIHEDDEFEGEVCFDLANALNPKAGVLEVVSVTVSPDGPTVGEPAKTSDNRKVIVPVSDHEEGTLYVYTITVSTTDGDPNLVRKGRFQAK